ncbi:2OG-Fe(II) oxygenase [Thalassococcus sp. S3]|uniref:2OG-Fe(II) oxygenase n=1 Tax=Thalassococcus sp. S3 TaxID=2017482 RepID=UPI0013EE854E|nr:2OG-Fe(II) oxygenase [Thalassococcus sp. S3]
MTFAIHDGLFSEPELANLDLPTDHYRPVTEYAPDKVVMDLWPQSAERPKSTTSFMIGHEEPDADTLSVAAQRISASCFAHVPWTVCHARYFHYDIGHRVVRHVDGTDKQMAAILYLSPDWDPSCSGELEVEFEGQTLDVPPMRGRVVVVGPDVPHGTKQVQRGERVSLVFFYANT